VLLFRGADKTIRNKSVQDAFQVSHSAGNVNLADVIRRFAANEVGPYSATCMRGRVVVPPTGMDENGTSPKRPRPRSKTARINQNGPNQNGP